MSEQQSDRSTPRSRFTTSQSIVLAVLIALNLVVLALAVMALLGYLTV